MVRLLPAVLLGALAASAVAVEDPQASAPEGAEAPTGADVKRVEPTAAPVTGRIDGPSVEIITGGSSTDGAARVGRMPVVD